jgi:dTDP-4-amino-4,6-dideoxygalactose transaminase
LKLCLETIAAERGRVRVGVQAFTCTAIVEAILAAGQEPVFFDIDPANFSTGPDQIDWRSVDVLVLTHLFGIPNPHYRDLCAAANAADVPVIEDLAQTVGAAVDGIELGMLTAAAIYSFAADKPLSAYRGGALQVRDATLRKRLVRRHTELEEESPRRQRQDLRRLALLVSATDPRRYRAGTAFYGPLVESLGRIPAPSSAAAGLVSAAQYGLAHVPLASRVRSKLLNLLHDERLCSPKRSNLRQCYLDAIWSDYERLRQQRAEAACLARAWVMQVAPEAQQPHLSDRQVYGGTRWPVLLDPCDRHRFLQRARALGLEAGSFNWPQLAFEPWAERLGERAETYPAAAAATRRIVNLPLWPLDFWRAVAA